MPHPQRGLRVAQAHVELLDAQLFRKYDKGGAGTISGNDLRRGLKHLKTMKPQLAPVALATLRAHFGVAGGGGVVVDGGLDAPVDYLRLVSWLAVRLDKVAKRASKVLKAALSNGGLSPSRAEALLSQDEKAAVATALDLEPSALIDVQQLNSLLNRLGAFTLADARSLVLRCSSSPSTLRIDVDGLLRIARNVYYNDGGGGGGAAVDEGEAAAPHGGGRKSGRSGGEGGGGSRRSHRKHEHQDDGQARVEIGGGGGGGGGRRSRPSSANRSRPSSASERRDLLVEVGGGAMQFPQETITEEVESR